MEVSLEWLSDFVELPETSQLVERLTKVGVAVDAVRDPGAAVSGVVVAAVEKVEPHPEADRLKIATVFDGAQRYRVVCGAPNVAAGQKVPYAKLGAKLPGMSIERRSIRGVDSQGMLCGKSELGLEEKSPGLWELPAAAELGVDIFRAAELMPTLVLDVTPNRPDLLSHLGVAREIAAATGKRMKSPAWRVTEKGGEASASARVVVDDPAGCRRYCARVIKNLKIGPSPAWLQQRLEQAGMRPINNIVDATNFVLLELGQPLHAFDLGRLAVEAGIPTVHVRRAKDGEPLKLIDGKIVNLEADDLVIADASGPVALAGVMGGADSEVGEATTAILLESAYFEPTRVRRTARRLGLKTEASRRFERGADPGIAQKAADRCAQILVDIAGGEVAKGVLEVAQKAEPAREIVLRNDRVARLLGIDLPPETVVQLLEPLEIRCVARNEVSLRFAPPSFRPDLTREVDLIEEVARRYGYDKVPERLPDGGGAYYSEPRAVRLDAKAREALLPTGCTEVVTFGFGSPQSYDPALVGGGEALRLINPLGEELSALRTTLLPGLLNVLSHNQRHGRRDLRLFEIGTVFSRRAQNPADDEMDRELAAEDLRVGVVLTGARHQGRWHGQGEVDFYDLAGVLEDLCEALDPAQPVARVPAEHAVLSPACAARLVSGQIEVGWAGQVHPRLLAKLEVTGPVFAAELSLSPLGAQPRRVVHQPLPRFPGTRRDVAVIAPKTLPAETLRRFLVERAGGALGPAVVEEVRLFDVYQKKPIPETHVSLAFAIQYRSRERTLTDAEVGQAFEQVQAEVKEKFQVEVRSAS